MSDNSMWQAPHIAPSITYSDLARAIDWLARVFGFHERTNARLTWPSGGKRWEISQRGRDLAPERWILPPGVTRGVTG